MNVGLKSGLLRIKTTTFPLVILNVTSLPKPKSLSSGFQFFWIKHCFFYKEECFCLFNAAL